MTRRAAEELGCKPLARIIGKNKLRMIENENEFLQLLLMRQLLQLISVLHLL
jgi:hypothetical protein